MGARGLAQESCTSSLGYLKGADSVRVLNGLVMDPTFPTTQRHAAAALGQIGDPSSGPALLQGLRSASSPEAVTMLVMALEKFGYESAAPEILSRLLESTSATDQGFYARALATLHYQEAVPTIQRLVKVTTITADWMSKAGGDPFGSMMEISLMRLTAPWGAPADGIRLLLLPPVYSTSHPTLLAVVIENVGDRDQAILGTPAHVFVDGKDSGRNHCDRGFDLRTVRSMGFRPACSICRACGKRRAIPISSNAA